MFSLGVPGGQGGRLTEVSAAAAAAAGVAVVVAAAVESPLGGSLVMARGGDSCAGTLFGGRCWRGFNGRRRPGMVRASRHLLQPRCHPPHRSTIHTTRPPCDISRPRNKIWYSRAPSRFPAANRTPLGLRITTLHLQPRDARQAAQVPSRDLTRLHTASRNLYLPRLHTYLPPRTTRADKIDLIDKKHLEIKPHEDAEVYTTLAALADELPEHAPRFVLLSYPLTLSTGRSAAPYVLLSYMPPTTNSELRMLYASAKELMRNTAEVGRVIEVANEEEVLGVEEVLRG